LTSSSVALGKNELEIGFNMTVRRLAEPALQPKNFFFTADNGAWLDELTAVSGEVDQ
jgi:hypothetical protein